MCVRNGNSNMTRPPKAPIHHFSLSFKSPKLQRVYAKYYVARSIKLVRIGLVLGMMLYMLYSFLDKYIVPTTAPQIFTMRIIISLLFLLAFGLSYTKLMQKNLQLIMSLLVLAAGLGIIWMILISEAIGGIYYYAGLILVILYAHGISRLRFIYAGLTTWIIVVIYESHIFGLGVTPPLIAINNTFFLLSANLLGMFSSYALEFYMRRTFWQNHILNAKSKQLRVEHQRKSRELESARRIQLAMLPQRLPQHPSIDLSASMKLATKIGGDYYDYSVTDDGTLTFAIGDATGHGARAGVMVTAIKLMFANYAAHQDIVEFLHRTSQSLKQMQLPQLYMALAVGRIKNNSLEIAGTGLPPALIFKSRLRTIEEIPLKGVPLGGYGSDFYEKYTIELESGDTLILMTDGFPELFNNNGEELGYDKAKEIFLTVAGQSPNNIVNRFNRIAASWMNGRPQEDDMTILVAKKK